MRLGRRVARILFWGLVLCFTSLAGGLWCAYSYITDSETISKIIREHAVRYLPRAILDPGRVRPRVLAGELTFHDLRLRQAIDGDLFETLRIPFLQFQVNPRKLAEGKFEPSRIMVGQPTLRLRCRKDGTWNLQGLLADPWPGPWIETPPIQISHGTVELYPCDDSGSTPEQTAPETPRSSGKDAQARAPNPAADKSPAILRDVTLRIEPGGKGQGDLKFEGSASGDGFERVTFNGRIDLKTGNLQLAGDLSGLVLSEALRRKLPPGPRRILQKLALNGGLVDLTLNRMIYVPADPPESRLRCSLVARLREGVWECPELPFTVNDLSAEVAIEERVVTIKYARGTNGNTALTADGVIRLDGDKKDAIDLHVNLDDLELDDERLRKRTPDDYMELWDLFKPKGRVNVDLRVARPRADAPVDWTARVHCRDVSAVYRHFRYPLDHLTGDLIFEKNTVRLGLKSQSGRPIQLIGTIWNPGPDAVVKLDIKAEALPIDDAIKNAMPRDVRKVVDEFGASGLVNVSAKVYREPMKGATLAPKGLSSSMPTST